jgi:hypothetical protein
LDNDFHVGFLHFFADFVVNDEAAKAVQDGTKEVESASDVEVTDIDVPVFMGLQRLYEAGAFLGDVGGRPGQKSFGLEDAIDAGGTARDDIGIEHHEGESSVAFAGVLAGEDADALFFVVGEPVVTGDPGVMLIDLAEARDPIVILADADADPRQEATQSNAGLVAPVADEIDDLVAGIVGNPAAL